MLSLVLARVWLAIRPVWLAALTRGFRKEPPQMDFSEEAAIMADDGEAVPPDEEAQLGWRPAPSYSSNGAAR